MAFVVALLLLNIFGGFAAPSVDLEYDPMENPDLFEGDIDIDEDDTDRSATVVFGQLWLDHNGTIPYEIDRELPKTINEDVLQTALNEYNNKTCLKFKPRTNEKDYIKFIPGVGCHTKVGRRGGQHLIHLGSGCGHVGIILHEIGHAIGFYHEHNRSDRHEHLIILWENIIEGKQSQFRQRDPGTDLLLTPFAYDSIMLYGSNFFSKNRATLRTMISKHKKVLPDSRRKLHLSETDILRIKLLYNNCHRSN